MSAEHDSIDESWTPAVQLAGSSQSVPGGDFLQTILRWREAEERREAVETAEASGGMFDFDDLPKAVLPAPDPREALHVPLGLSPKENAKFAAKALQKCLDDHHRPRTARQAIEDALEEELRAVPSASGTRRRELRAKAAQDTALAPADPGPTQQETRQWGHLLAILLKDHPGKKFGPQIGDGGKIEQPLPQLLIEEAEAIGILYRRADVHVRNGDLKRYPLHKAAERAYPKLVRELIGFDADPNKADFAGETPLHTAAHSGQWCEAIATERHLVIESLVDGRADVNFANPRGRTPLHIAASAGDGTIMGALLQEGADVNAGDLGGFTPLMWAAGWGFQREVEALLDHLADPTLQANRGQTALLFALTNGQTPVQLALEQRLALTDQDNGTQQNSLEGTEELAEELEPSTVLANPYKWPKQTLHFPYMGRVREDYVPDMRSNAY